MNNDDEFRVWIGCLSCYNNGDLIGQWYDASEAGEVTTKSLHAAAGIEVNDEGYPPGRDALYGPHEELWVMDTDCAPKGYDREMDPMTAQAVADRLAEVDEYNRDAFAAWCEYQGYDLVEAEISDFEDHYRGHYDSFRDYSDDMADETLLGEHRLLMSPGESPRDLIMFRYFDYEAFARDMRFEHTILDAPSGVYIFSY